MIFTLANLPRKLKQAIMVLSDLFILPFAFWAALALRLSSWTPEVPSMYILLVAAPLIAIPIFVPLGLYRTVLRYADERLFFTTIYGISLTVLVMALFVLMMNITGIPRSAFIIFWFLAVGFVSAIRIFAREIIKRVESRESGRKRQRIAVYGAGKAGIQLAMALRSSPEFRVVAFFDEDLDLHGTNVFGLRVFSPQRIHKVVNALDIKGVILAIPSASRARRAEVIQTLEPLGLNLRTLPGMAELVDNKVRIEDLREVGIEDILGRDPIPPNELLMTKKIEGLVVLVTGAGGSIGSELCRQIVQRNPSKLILVENSELALYRIDMELRQFCPGVKIVPILGDVKNQSILRDLFKSHGVQTIFHAAAYKHVPLVESNIAVGVQNNVIGTLATALAAVECGVSSFVLISTDKAVRPTNIMGASKRLAEMLVQAIAKNSSDEATGFSIVRFGNVLGSSGSVVPLFKDQIRRGGPITITHPDITRYFMTIPEAAQLVIQAGSLCKGGEVFVLDMGEPIKILTLAKKMIQLSGLSVKDSENPEGDIALDFVGLRPGEKLFEELIIGKNVSRTEHPRIMRAEEHFVHWSELKDVLVNLEQMCLRGDSGGVRNLLIEWVAEYEPQGESVLAKTPGVVSTPGIYW